MGHPAANRIRNAVGMGLLLTAATLLLWACLQAPISLLGSGRDGGRDGGSTAAADGAPAILGLFSMSGCAELTFPAGAPQCLGTAPLRVRLILLALGATSHRFQVVRATASGDGGASDGGDGGDGGGSDGGSDSLLDDTSSRSDAPELVLSGPGTYLVSLGVAGPGGTATAAGTIIVLPAGLGAPCDTSGECAAGLRCLCGRGSSDGTCPAGLSVGMCTRSCDGTACPGDSVCIDLSRSALPAGSDGGAAKDSWRQPICAPACGGDGGCRSDLVCRELPLLKPGESAGGLFQWGASCFASVPGGVGQSCLGGNEKPDPSTCAFGICDSLGLRALCTATCDAGCPSSSACAVWNGTAAPAPSAPRCMPRCDMMHPCTDPLLDCLVGGATGTLGFKLPGEPLGTAVCAPRRCTMATDCPGGQCVALGGASFCTR